MRTFEPLGDLIILDINIGDTVSKGGIIMPSVAMKAELKIAKVLAVGPGKWEDGKQIPMLVKVGDTVVYNSYEGSTVLIDEKKVFGVHQKAIWGRILDEPQQAD